MEHPNKVRKWRGGTLLGDSATAEKKEGKVLSHLGGQRVRFQEESLLVTSIEQSSPHFWGKAQSITHSAEKGESLPVGLMETIVSAIQDWLKACLSSDRSLTFRGTEKQLQQTQEGQGEN